MGLRAYVNKDNYVIARRKTVENLIFSDKRTIGVVTILHDRSTRIWTEF